MSVAVLVGRLETRGVSFSAVDGRLRCRAPKGTLSSGDLAQLTEHKAAILRLLEPEPADTAQQRTQLAAGDYLPCRESETTAAYLSRYAAPQSSCAARPIAIGSLSGAALVLHLRQSGYRISLRADRFSIDFSPGLMAMPMRVFDAVTTRVHEIREVLQVQGQGRPQ